MMRVVALAFGALILACVRASAADATFDVVSYDVQLTPDFQAARVSGSETIRFRSLTDDLRQISFSANSLDVTASIGGEAMVPNAVEGERRVFNLPAPLRRGQVAEMRLSFSGPAPKGLEFSGGRVRATYFTCDYMVCDSDAPGDKARVTFALDLPRGSEAVAPGALVSRKAVGGLERWSFKETRGTSAYLLGFAGGAYKRTEVSPGLFVLSAPEQAPRVRAMFGETERMVFYFGQRSGVQLAPGYTQVLVEGSEAQEAARHSTIGLEEIEPILTDPHEDWAIAHELAHQWWGNSLTCRDWSELWLNEGLTVFMVAAYKQARWGDADYAREMELAQKRWDAAKAQNFDVPLSWQGKYPSLKLKRAMAYAKAVVFLDTLRRAMGDDAFWRGIKRYTRDNKDRVVTARDFERAMAAESGRVAPLFAQWVYGTRSFN